MKWVFKYLRGTSDYGFCYQGRPRLDRVLDIHGFLVQIELKIWIKEDLQVGMCLIYLEVQSVG